MGSSRLPGKSFELIAGMPVFEIVLRRLSKSRLIKRIILATSIDKRDDILERHTKRIGFDCFRGSENDLVERYYKAAKNFNCKHLLRVTADNVFIDWKEIDRQIDYGIENNCDFVTWKNPSIPERMNDFAGEFISFSGLKKVFEITSNTFDREHVYPFFLNNEDKFKVHKLDVSEEIRTHIKFDLDTQKDLDIIRITGENIRDPINTPAWEIVKTAERLFGFKQRKVD